MIYIAICFWYNFFTEEPVTKDFFIIFIEISVNLVLNNRKMTYRLHRVTRTWSPGLNLIRDSSVMGIQQATRKPCE